MAPLHPRECTVPTSACASSASQTSYLFHFSLLEPAFTCAEPCSQSGAMLLPEAQTPRIRLSSPLPSLVKFLHRPSGCVGTSFWRAHVAAVLDGAHTNGP